MNLNALYMDILKCDCGRSFDINQNDMNCRNCQSNYTVTDGYVNFFKDESKRPFWSIHMQTEFENHGIHLDMPANYNAFETFYKNNTTAINFFQTVISSGRVIIDLASGPSGYVSTIVKNLKEEQFFIITDGSPMIINAHKIANKTNSKVGYLDLDLDDKLPLLDNSIDCFTGRFLDNVMAQRQLLEEIFRCLKTDGLYAVMELFFEDNSETSNLLIEKGKLTATHDKYVAFCESIGFTLISSEIVESYVGKLDESDELPINDTDKSNVFALLFVKRVN